MSRPTRDRARGLMAGVGVGDCLGRPIEGARVVTERYLEEVMVRPPRLYSDDTLLTMVVAESLLACDGFSGDDLARRFVEAWEFEPHRGFGGALIQLLGAISRGRPWEEAARSQFDGQGSYGNGAAMRVAPVALWAHPDLEETVRLAAETARVTHTHPLGIEGAVIQAVAVHHALDDDSSADRLLTTLDDLAVTPEFRAKLEMLPDLVAARDHEKARLHLGNGLAAHDSVPAALYCFLVTANFTEAILTSLSLGGDADTIAAMTGALCGARYGHQQIPGQWHDLEASDRLVELADAMLARGAGG